MKMNIEQQNLQEEQQQKAVEEAIIDARQNTTKGQIYQQFYSILVFVALICCFISYSVLRVFDSYGDQSLRFPGYLYGSDFHLNIQELLPQEKTLRPRLSSNFHHDYYACDELRFGPPQHKQYVFGYSSRSSPVLQFTVPAKFDSEVFFKLSFDKSQEITMIDQLCVQQKCVQLKDLMETNFQSELRCMSNRPCVIRVQFKPVRQQIFDIQVHMLQQQRVFIEDCLFFYKQFNFQNAKFLVIKSNLNQEQLDNPPSLKIEFQTEFLLKCLKIIGFGSGIVVFVVVLSIYISSRKRWEASIKGKVIQEVINKQKVQQHIDKIKQAMKNEKDKK